MKNIRATFWATIFLGIGFTGAFAAQAQAEAAAQQRCSGGEIHYGNIPQDCSQINNMEECGRFNCFWDGSYNGTRSWCDGGPIDDRQIPTSCAELRSEAGCLSYYECRWE